MIPPGQAGKIDVTVATGKLRGDFGKGVTVYSDDPANPRLRLVVRGRVEGSVELLPRPTLSLSNRAGTKLGSRLLIRQDPSESGTLDVRNVQVSDPALTATVSQIEEPGSGIAGLPNARPGDWVLEVGVAGSMTYGRSTAQVTFQTGLPREPVITVPVSIMVMPPVNVSKNRIVFPEESGESVTETILVSVRRGIPAEGLEVDVQPSSLQARLESAGDRKYRLDVRWDGRQQLDEGKVTLSVAGQSFEIPVLRGQPEPEPPRVPTRKGAQTPRLIKPGKR